MLFPPSLAQAVLSRVFHARNGEIGLLLADASAFLDACEADGAVVLGWELWLIDHGWSPMGTAPEWAPGVWCGLIPGRGESRPYVVHGEGDCAVSRAELANLDLDSWIEPRWAGHVRVNFTLDVD